MRCNDGPIYFSTGKLFHLNPQSSNHLQSRYHYAATKETQPSFCRPSLSVQSNRHLRSAEQGLLHVPFGRTSTMQSRAFSVVGPLVWNGLPLALRSLPRVFSQKFLQQLKTILFGRAGVGSASQYPHLKRRY